MFLFLTVCLSLQKKQQCINYILSYNFRRSWVCLNLLVWSVRPMIPINVFSGCSSSHGLPGPFPRHVRLILFFSYKEQGEQKPFVGGWLAVSSWRWFLEKDRVLHPCRSLLLMVSNQQSQPVPGTWGEHGPTCSPQTCNISITWNLLEMQVPGLHPKSIDSETLQVEPRNLL